MAFANIPDSKLSPALAVFLGKAKADLKIKINRELDNLEKKVKDDCLNVDQLEQISKSLSQIQKKVTGYKNNVEKISKSILEPLSKVVLGLQVALLVIELLPVPNIGTTVGVVVQASANRQRIKELIKQISDDIKTITGIIGVSTTVAGGATTGVFQAISVAEQKINKIDSFIGQCKKLGKIEEEISPGVPENINETNNTTEQSYTSIEGNTYTIRVVIIDDTKIAPQRQAIAVDSRGIIRFSGEPSFSSSTDILIKELQFKIDNNIL